MSICDWLCIKRALTGSNPNTGVTTELSSMFDSFEGQSVQNASELCYSFILPIEAGQPIRAAVVNSFSECPPLALFPVKKRDTSTWEANGDYALEAWEWAQEPRYLVSNREMNVYVDNTKWTDVISSGNGWTITYYNNEVDNTENCTITLNTIASARPWHGWFGLYDLTVPTSGISYYWIDNLYCRGLSTVFQSSGGVHYKYWPLPGYKEFDYTIGTNDWKYPSLSRYNRDRILLTYVDSGKLYEKLTADYETWYDLENYGMNILYPKNILIGTTRARMWFQYVSGDSGTGICIFSTKKRLEAGQHLFLQL